MARQASYRSSSCCSSYEFRVAGEAGSLAQAVIGEASCRAAFGWNECSKFVCSFLHKESKNIKTSRIFATFASVCFLNDCTVRNSERNPHIFENFTYFWYFKAQQNLKIQQLFYSKTIFFFKILQITTKEIEKKCLQWRRSMFYSVVQNTN